MPMPAPPLLDKPRSNFRVGKFAEIASSITRIESKLDHLERKADPEIKNPFQKRRLLRPTLSQKAADRQKAAMLI